MKSDFVLCTRCRKIIGCIIDSKEKDCYSCSEANTCPYRFTQCRIPESKEIICEYCGYKRGRTEKAA